MNEKFKKYDVVCFKEKHKWVGCLGFVNDVKKVIDDNGHDTLRIMVGVSVPLDGVAYIFVSPDEIENLNAVYPYDIK